MPLEYNQPDVLEEVLIDDETADSNSGNHAELIVYNDDHNTFDWVIQCLVEVCKHSQEQAEQLSLIVHFKGKATVKTAPKSQLVPLKASLVHRGLSVVIEDLS
ncbi:MAG TPA: ATP-dependent Clp protease adaptor ClpS [Saprospiraceae bacterium]|nr:ATP-dependent Clp protease adaptor ClpS [Saprospiraceae bacterium]